MLPSAVRARKQARTRSYHVTSQMPRVSIRFHCAALAFLLLVGAVSSEAQPVARQVLLLQSVDRGSLAIDRFTGNFRVELDQRAETSVNVVQIVVGPTGFVGASEPAVVDYIRSSFVDRPKPDLIVSIGGPAAVFARKFRRQLFPDTPTLFASVDQRYLGDAPLGEDETAVAVVNDYPRVIEDILRLLPQTRQVFVVTGSGQIGQFWHRELENAFRRFHDRLTFVWFEDLSLAGDPAPLCQPAGQLGDLVCNVRHGRDGGRVCGPASVRRPSRRGQCTPVCGAERVPRRRNRRRIAAAHRRSQSPHSRRGRSTLERRAAEQRESAATARRSTDLRLARATAVGHPREPVAAGQRRALSRVRACGRNTGARCSAPSACWPSNRS